VMLQEKQLQPLQRDQLHLHLKVCINANFNKCHGGCPGQNNSIFVDYVDRIYQIKL
jgi:hypothetical protein